MADQMTFEQFRPYIQQKYAAVFAAGFALPSQVNPVLDVPVGEPLHKVVRFMAKIVANDFGGLLTLALYGYGLSGAKVARSMFEASVNAAYLAKHPECVDDYIDFNVGREKEVLRPFTKIRCGGCEGDRSGEDRGNGNGARTGVAPLQETRTRGPGGGAPLSRGGERVAGVGVSGGTVEQDVAILEAALQDA